MLHTLWDHGWFAFSCKNIFLFYKYKCIPVKNMKTFGNINQKVTLLNLYCAEVHHDDMEIFSKWPNQKYYHVLNSSPSVSGNEHVSKAYL